MVLLWGTYVLPGHRSSTSKTCCGGGRPWLLCLVRIDKSVKLRIAINALFSRAREPSLYDFVAGSVFFSTTSMFVLGEMGWSRMCFVDGRNVNASTLVC